MTLMVVKVVSQITINNLEVLLVLNVQVFVVNVLQLMFVKIVIQMVEILNQPVTVVYLIIL